MKKVKRNQSDLVNKFSSTSGRCLSVQRQCHGMKISMLFPDFTLCVRWNQGLSQKFPTPGDVFEFQCHRGQKSFFPGFEIIVFCMYFVSVAVSLGMEMLLDIPSKVRHYWPALLALLYICMNENFQVYPGSPPLASWVWFVQL